MFPNLHPDERLRLQEILLGCVPEQTIFLLGNTDMQKRTTSIFNMEQPSCRYTAHYFILSLVNKNGTSLTALQDQLENRLRGYIPSTVLVIDIEQFNNWLKEGQYFACRVLQRGILLHRQHELPAVTPADAHGLSDKKENGFEKSISLVHEFIAGAELYRLRKQFTLSAFMLHQAAEYGLKALLHHTCGLQFNTHNLDKLTRLCSLATWKISEIIPGHRERDKQLLNKLQEAYIGARYKEYHIREEELDILSGKIKTLLEVIQNADHRNDKKVHEN